MTVMARGGQAPPAVPPPFHCADMPTFVGGGVPAQPGHADEVL
jgi:hypothetical protein